MTLTARLTTQIEQDAAAHPIITMIDGYDGVGNRTSRVQDGVAYTWTYDDDYRLTGQQSAGAWATFTMDANGNILSKQHQGQNPLTMTYDDADRLGPSLQGASIGLNVFTFDANGNQIKKSGAALGTQPTWWFYDPENRLIGVGVGNIPSPTATYTYSGDGLRRTAQELGGARTTFVWDGSDYLGEVR